MAKPPRKIPSSSTSPDGSALPTRSTAAQDPDPVAAVSGPGSSRQTRAPGTNERAVETTASETPRESAVVVNPLPGATPERVAAAMAMITLRPEQVAALRAVDNEPGLFRSEYRDETLRDRLGLDPVPSQFDTAEPVKRSA